MTMVWCLADLFEGQIDNLFNENITLQMPTSKLIIDILWIVI